MSGLLAGVTIGLLIGGGWGFLAYRSLYRRTLGRAGMDADRMASVLEAHQIEWVGWDEGYACGCDDHGELPHMPFLADALRHQAQMILKDSAPAPAVVKEAGANPEEIGT